MVEPSETQVSLPHCRKESRDPGLSTSRKSDTHASQGQVGKYFGIGQSSVSMNEIALKCREPSPAHMQISTCAYLISM